MRILDVGADKRINEITIYLTINEAKEMLDSLEDLIRDRDKHHHHIDGEDFEDQMTVAIYNKENLLGFDERSRRIILEGK